MDKRTLGILEYGKIIEKLAAECCSQMTREAALKLHPSYKPAWIADELQGTEEAVTVIMRKGTPPLGNFYDISGLAHLAAKEGRLTMRQLLQVAYNLNSANQTKKYLSSDLPQLPRIDGLVSAICVLDRLHDEITRCILTEDEMAEQYEKACDFLAAAKEADANGEEGANMEALAQEYGVGFLSQVLRGYFGEYSEDLNSIIVNMENGEISDIIETEAGYMIIRMDNNNDEEFKDFSMTYIAQQSAETLFTTVQDNWIAGSGVANVVVNYDALNDSQIVSLSSYLYGNGMVISGGSN